MIWQIFSELVTTLLSNPLKFKTQKKVDFTLANNKIIKIFLKILYINF